MVQTVGYFSQIFQQNYVSGEAARLRAFPKEKEVEAKCVAV